MEKFCKLFVRSIKEKDPRGCPYKKKKYLGFHPVDQISMLPEFLFRS